ARRAVSRAGFVDGGLPPPLGGALRPPGRPARSAQAAAERRAGEGGAAPNLQLTQGARPMTGNPVTTQPTGPTKPPPIRIERILHASPPDVWEMWTTRYGLEAWWGAEGPNARALPLD